MTVYPEGDLAITIGPGVGLHGTYIPGGHICWARPSDGKFVVLPDWRAVGEESKSMTTLWLAIVGNLHLGLGRVARFSMWPEGARPRRNMG